MNRVYTDIGIVTFPISTSGLMPLRNLAAILYPSVNRLYIITGDDGLEIEADEKIYVTGITYRMGSNTLSRIVRFSIAQIRISYKVIQASNKVNVFLFFLGGPSLLIPGITVKLLRKKLVCVLAGSDYESTKAQHRFLALPIKIMAEINLALSDRIVVYSGNIIEEAKLQKYQRKTSVAHRHFIDFDKFKMCTQLNDRNNLVGYIGRLSEEKGIVNLVKAIPNILKKRSEVNFLIGGDGQLRGEIERDINEYKLNEKVKLAGWIAHDNLPQYFNELKLIILPSYTEGLPNIMLEAMACGTPVLATPVGAIPDFIKDGETGFIMEDNSPECIAKNVIRALNHPNLERITKNAHDTVEKEFTYEKAVERYREILNTL